jgi:hypothetical protein
MGYREGESMVTMSMRMKKRKKRRLTSDQMAGPALGIRSCQLQLLPL